MVYRNSHSGNLSWVIKTTISYTDTKISKVESRRVLGIPYKSIWFDEGLGKSSVPPAPNLLQGSTCGPLPKPPASPCVFSAKPIQGNLDTKPPAVKRREHQHQPSVRYGYSLHYRHCILHGSYLSFFSSRGRDICAWTWTRTWHNIGQSSHLAAPLQQPSPPVSDDDVFELRRRQGFICKDDGLATRSHTITSNQEQGQQKRLLYSSSLRTIKTRPAPIVCVHTREQGHTYLHNTLQFNFHQSPLLCSLGTH